MWKRGISPRDGRWWLLCLEFQNRRGYELAAAHSCSEVVPPLVET